jgi:hypothetical protein
LLVCYYTKSFKRFFLTNSSPIRDILPIVSHSTLKLLLKGRGHTADTTP